MQSNDKQKETYDNEVDTDNDSDISGSDIDTGDDFSQIINHFFTNENGQNIVDVLSDIKTSLDTNNKLIYKLLSLNSQNKK